MNPSSSTVGTVEYDARIRTDQLKKDAAETEAITKKTNQAIVASANDTEEKGSSAIGNMVKNGARELAAFAAKAAAAFGVATVAATGFALKSAADFEQTRIGLENMLGSADAARSLLRDVSQFAAATPFEFPELADATRQLIAFGFSGEDAFKTMKQLGDVSAAVGAPIGDLAYLMGTLKTQGRAFTIDIRQFAQRGIPIYEYLAKTLNKTTAEVNSMIEAGKIGFPEVAKAFEAMTGSGGKFFGTMDKQSQSLSGRFSTLKDNIGLAARELVGISQEGDIRAGSIFDRVSKGAQSLNDQLSKIDWAAVANKAMKMSEGVQDAVVGLGKDIIKVAEAVGDYLGPKFATLGRTIKSDVLPALENLWQYGIKPLLPIVGGALVVGVGLLVDALNVAGHVIGFFGDHLEAVLPILAAAGTAFIGLKTAMAINAGIDALTIGFNTLRLITIPSLMVSLGALQAFFMTPWGLAMTAAILGITALTAGFVANKTNADKLKDANAQLAQSNRDLKAAQDQLINSQLGVEGASLNVEQAQRRYNDAIAQYGPKSLEARQALHDLKQAQFDLKRAQDDSQKSLQNLVDKQREVAKDKELVKHLKEVQDNLSDVGKNALNAGQQIQRLDGSKVTVKTSKNASGTEVIDFKATFGARAKGGPVSAGQPYLVGEEGPEVIVPRSAGTVIPNHELGDAYSPASSAAPVTVQLNMSGIMTRSRADERAIAKSMLEAINEELRAKSLPEIGGGALRGAPATL